MRLTEKQISTQLKYDGKILRLHLDEVRLPDGTIGKREYVTHSGGSAVLFLKEGCVALVRQYRYAYGKEIYEIPAGKLNAGEEPVKAALRELEEETGYRAEKALRMLEIYPSPGYTNEVIHIYFVKDAEFVGEKPDDDEFLSCEFMPLDNVLRLIESGEICDAKTVAAIYKYVSENGNKK